MLVDVTLTPNLGNITPALNDKLVLQDTSSGDVLATSSISAVLALGTFGVSDHGALDGLGDDDHTQYLNNTRGDIRYYTKSAADTLLSGKETADANIVKKNVSQTFTKAQTQALVTLTDATTVAWNLQDGNIAKLTLGGNRTLGLPTNIAAGVWILIVEQDATGSRTLVYNGVFKPVGKTYPVLSTAPFSVDILSIVSDGTNLFIVPNFNF